MKFNKTVLKALATSLCLTIVAGCTPTTPTTAPTVSATNAPATQASAAPEASVEPTKPAGPPVELKIHWHSGNMYTLNDKDGKLLGVYQLAADATNTKIISVANPAGTRSADEFQMQAAEKFPADIYGGNSLRNAIYSFGDEGAFLPLNDLIEKYGPNITAYFEKRPEIKKALTAPDGNIFMLPYVPDGKVGRAYFIRTDWLKKLNLETPKTLEELEAVLFAFRDKDPNGNGKQDEIPYFNDKFDELIRLANLWGARVYGNDASSERVILREDGTMYHGWTDPAFKEGLIGLARWYKEKLVDQEMWTRKANSARGTLFTKENTGGMTHDWVASTTNYNYNSELLSAVPDFKIEAFLPVSGPQGAGFEEHKRADLKPDGWAISASSKNPEAAIRYMDWFYSPEGNRAINYGVEGESYTMVDGKPILVEEVLKQSEVNKYLYGTWGAQLPIGYQQDYEYERQWTTKEGVDAYNLYSESDVYKGVTQTPSMLFTSEEIAVRNECLSALHTYQDQMVQEFITGKKDINKEWDAYVARCKEIGSDKIVDTYTAAYARFLSSK